MVLKYNYPFIDNSYPGDFDLSIYHPFAPIHLTSLILEYIYNNHSEDTPYPKGIRLEPQPEEGYVSISSEYPGAIGQGETEEEAIRDIQEAIALLKEEEMNPSGDQFWPENFR